MKKQLASVSRLTLNVAFVVLAMGGAAYAQTGAVPEIDAGSAASALTLIVGAGLFLKDKFRAK
jgi:hypothetical protein